ncbi:MAG: Ig-like domain-containing protein [Magnetococcales bacterium]|nr:Ig-like domain-containing protein [Magnetococcales bacterium]
MSDDYFASIETTGSIQPDDLLFVGAVEESGDSDWFAITLSAGTTYDFFLAGTENDGLLDPILSLYNAAGAFLVLDDDSGAGSNAWLTYTPTASGTFYLGARGYGSDIGSYGLQAAIRTDDQLATTQTTGLLALNTPATGTIEYSGDHDWLKITLTAGITYHFSAVGAEGENGLADPNLVLYNRSNLEVATDDDGGQGVNALLAYTPTLSGRYYLDVSGFEASTGGYVVEVSTATTDDHQDNAQTTGEVTVDAAGTEGVIENVGDVDWLAVTLTAATNYQFAVTSETLTDSAVTLYDEQGRSIAFDDDGGDGLQALLSHTPATSGRYYLAVQGGSGATGAYTVSATTGGDDYANDHSSTGKAVLGQTVGTLERAEDQDWFSIYLSSSRTYTIDLLGAPSGAGTLADPQFLGLHQRDGTLIPGTSSQDFGDTTESRITFTPESGGTYFMAVGGAGEQTGTYQLKVARSATLIDTPNNTSTTKRLLLNGRAKDQIRGSGDVDWYRVSLTAGQTYIFEEQSNTTAAKPLADPYIRGIYNSAGRLVPNTSNNNYGASVNALVQFTPATTGIYYVAAGAQGTRNGSYVLTLAQRTNTTDLIGATMETAEPMSVDAPAASTIDALFEQDWFAVDLTADQPYEITLRGAASGEGTLLDPLLVGVYDATGTLIPGTGNDDGPDSRDAQTFFQPATTGTYYLAAAGYNDGTGSYTLTIQPGATTDLLDNATTTGVVAAGESMGSAIDAPGDVDWVRVALQEATPYRIQQLGAPSSDGSLDDPVILGVYDAAGQALDHSYNNDQNDTLNASVTVTAATTGDYYIALSGNQGATGSYLVTVSEDHALADEASPALVASSLVEETTISPQENLTLEFSEAIQAGAGNVHISSGTTQLTVPIASSQISFSGNHLTLNLQDNLEQNVNYQLWLDPGAVVDHAGNPLTDIGSTATAIPFSTGIVPLRKDDWTVMVYMAGDNNLEGEAIADLNEMEMVNLPAGVNVVTQLDRIGGYDMSNGNWTDTRRGQVNYDFDSSSLVNMTTSLATVSSFSGFSRLGELNMGDPANLTSFIDWAKTTYPAEHYALIVWDHGGGLSGASWDDTNGGDRLSLNEMRRAMDNSSVDRFDLLGFDACLMGMVEVAWDFRDQTDVMVASEELVPGAGFPYDRFLNTLGENPNMNALDLGNRMVSSYGEEYQGVKNVTLSSVRSADLEPLKESLNAFVGTAIGANFVDRMMLRSAANWASPFPAKGQDYRDLGTFMELVDTLAISPTLKQAAQAVNRSLDQAVISDSGSVATANGLSIYMPPAGTDLRAYTPSMYSFLGSSNWDSFLSNAAGWSPII